ncbi:MAG: NUDIX hydrolase, partial [Cyclobacteriaceae bacterium]
SLKIAVGNLVFVSEVLRGPLHSIELFFEVTDFDGQVRTGTDPELSSDNQIISEIEWISEEKINQMPLEILHNVFKYLKNKEGLISFESLLRINAKYIS